MKTTKTLLSTLSVAALAVAFSACDTATNTTTNTTTANKANNTIVVTNANSTNTNAANTTNTNMSTNSSANTGAPTAENARFKGDYMVGDVKCTVKPDSSDLMHEIKCADKDKAQNYSRDDSPPKAVIISSDNEKVRFVFDDATNLASGNFTDDKGKTVKVTRVK